MPEATKPLNGYMAFDRGKKVEVYAKDMFEARILAAQKLKVKPRYAYRIAVVLCEVAGQEVTAHY